VRGTISRH